MKRHVYNCLTHTLKSIVAPIIVLEKSSLGSFTREKDKNIFSKVKP